MTEFKRTTQAVNDTERLVQVLLDGGGPEDAQRLSQLVAETCPMVEKLGRKAAETDPTKQTYGPQMREKVQQLVAQWSSVEGLAKDILQQRGVAVAPTQVQRTTAAPTQVQRTTEVPVAPSQVQRTTEVPVASPTLAGSSAGGRMDRREAAARAAEARSQRDGAASASSTSLAAPAAVPQLRHAAGEAIAVPMDVEEAPVTPAAVALPAGPPVQRMEELLHLVHCVFLSHGYRRADAGGDTPSSLPSSAGAGAGAFRVRYVHEEARAAPIVASYVPVQRHLIIYAALEGADGNAATAASRSTVQLGMAAASVQAKVDYLLVYPLVYRQCIPALVSIPPEVCFGLLAGLALPALAAIGAASRSFARAAFEDDVLWWRMVLALPQSEALAAAVAKAMEGKGGGDTLPAGTCRRLVREEVERQRKEAEERRKRKEEAERMERMLHETLLREDQMEGRLRQPFPGRGPGGLGILGGDRDLFPGGGFMPPFGGGGGRRPFGGGSGGGMFGGGGFM